MSLEQNKAVIRQLWWSERVKPAQELRLMDELFADDFVRYAPDGNMDRAGFEQRVAVLLKAFPDSCHTMEAMVAEGDLVAFHYILTGTDTGGYRSNPPTGKRFTQRQGNFCLFRGGKVVELRVFPVPPSIDEQLGITPSKR